MKGAYSFPEKMNRFSANAFIPHILAMIMAFLSFGLEGCAAPEKDLIIKKLEDEKEPKVRIGGGGITIPLGYWGVADLNNTFCAIRYLQIGEEEAPKNKVPNYMYGIYEWFYQGDGTGKFSLPTTAKNTGKATYQFIPFIGRFSFQRGNLEVNCADKIRLTWYGNSNLLFSYSRKEDTEEEILKFGVKIAPTPWADIKDVNVHDPRLTWYKYDSKREDLWIPVEELFKKSDKEK